MKKVELNKNKLSIRLSNERQSGAIETFNFLNPNIDKELKLLEGETLGLFRYRVSDNREPMKMFSIPWTLNIYPDPILFTPSSCIDAEMYLQQYRLDMVDIKGFRYIVLPGNSAEIQLLPGQSVAITFLLD